MDINPLESTGQCYGISMVSLLHDKVTHISQNSRLLVETAAYKQTFSQLACGKFKDWSTLYFFHIDVYYAGPCFNVNPLYHNDFTEWKHFPRYWPFVQRIHRSPVNSPHKGPWRVALMFSFICAWINGWVNNREAEDLRHHRAHYDITVMR